MTETELKSIGAGICDRRKQLAMTQERLADGMSVSVQMISNLERGIKAIKIDNLIKISEILGISTDYISTGKINARNPSDLSQKIAGLSATDYRMIGMLADFCLDNNISG